MGVDGIVEGVLPLADPLGAGLADLGDQLLAVGRGGRAAGAHAVADGVDEAAEGELGIGEDGDVGLVDLVEVAGVGVYVNQADALGDGPAVGGVGKAEGVADGEDGIGAAVDEVGRAGGVAALGVDAAAHGQGVVLGERALADQGARDGHGHELGELHRLVPCLCGEDATAHVHHGVLGVEENVGGALDVADVGSGATAGPDGLVVQDFVGDLLHQDVGGHLQDHRTGGAGAEVGEGAAHDGRDVLYAGHGALPLDEAVEDAGGDFLLDLAAHATEGVLAHEEQDGDVVGVGAGDAGEGVGGAGAGAGEGDAHLTGGAGEAVGDLDAHALVAGGEHRDLLGRPEGGPEGCLAAAGETGDVPDSFLFQGVDNCVAASHGCTPAVAFMSRGIRDRCRRALRRETGRNAAMIRGGGLRVKATVYLRRVIHHREHREHRDFWICLNRDFCDYGIALIFVFRSFPVIRGIKRRGSGVCAEDAEVCAWKLAGRGQVRPGSRGY